MNLNLDVAVAIQNWQAFEDICSTLKENHFKRYHETHKFFYKGKNGNMDFEVDIVPFGGVAVDEMIGWPPEGNPIMSVRCFNDVMKEAATVIIGDAVKVKIAPLCGQFLIKLDTWNDRHQKTDKDAEDMVFILKNYLDIQLLSKENKVPPDVVTIENESTDMVIWGAQWLAYDISKMLSKEHLFFYAELITSEIKKEEQSELVFHFMKYFGSNGVNDISDYYEPCRAIWIIIGRIFLDELKRRTENDS